MGETDEHRDEMVRHIKLLQRYYQGQQVYVSGNLLVYYEQGNPKKFVVPDTFVVKGIQPRKRRIYKIWVEGHVPNAVIETTSRKTRKKDTTDKPKLYAQLGIPEYFLFDPDQEYLEPPLQGYRLAGKEYVQIKPDEGRALVSQELGLSLRAEGGEVQFYRLDNGEQLLTPEEAELAAEKAQRAAQEAQRAAQEAQRAAQEAQRAAEERAATAEAEVKRLREELARREQDDRNQ